MRTSDGYLFARNHFPGFWAPELGFSMDLVPALCRHQYRYVIVDSEHVTALTPMGWEELRYRPHLADFGGEEIVVVVRDRELSNAQESGMDADPLDEHHRAHEKCPRTQQHRGLVSRQQPNAPPMSDGASNLHTGYHEVLRGLCRPSGGFQYQAVKP